MSESKQWYEYRIRPSGKRYVVEERYVYETPWGSRHEGDWYNIYVSDWFGFKYSSIVNSVSAGKRLIKKKKKQREKEDLRFKKEQKIQASRETIYIS